MGGCITPLVACRRLQHTVSSLLAHAEVLQHWGVGPANVSSSSSRSGGGRPAHAALQAAAAAPCQPSFATTSTSCWFSSSSSSRSLSSVADGDKSHSNKAEGAPEQTAANEPERQLTRQIRDAADVAELQQVVSDCCDSFTFIHTAAALTKCAKLSRSGQGNSELLPQQLVQKWLQQLHEAGVRECANVLWACAHLSRQQVDTVWGQTWAAFMQRVQQGSGQGMLPLHITKAVRVAAELHRQPAAGELQLLLQTFLQPDMLQSANSKHIKDLTWALDQLLGLPGRQEVISEQDMQQFRDMQQLLGQDQAERLLTRQITAAETVAQLSDVFNQQGGSFKSIHAAAALLKFAKLSSEGQRDSQEDSQVLQLLVRKWLQLLPEAGARECANILWGCVNLSKQHQQQADTVWDRTRAAFMQHIERDLQGQAGEALVPQQLANAVYAAAKLRKQPTAAELQLLVQAFLRPEVLAAADSQNIANTVWALSQLSQAPGWQGGVSEQNVQLLLGEQQLQVVASGTLQNVSNVLVALARMAAADPPLVERDFAQQCSMQLLSLVSTPVSNWGSQEAANTMWATAELGLPADVFVAKAVQAARSWVPKSVSQSLTQAAQACALLQYRDEAFLSLLLQRASVLSQQQQQQPGKARSGSRVLATADKAGLAALLAAAVAQLDMRQLAEQARDLVSSSRVGQQSYMHVSNPRRLWVFHAWLLQHQLLDGRGLTGLVTGQHLLQGHKDAEVYGTGVTIAQPIRKVVA